MKILISYYARNQYNPVRITMYFPKKYYKLIELKEIINILRAEVPILAGINLSEYTIGVFSRAKVLNYRVKDGDQIEIYQKIYVNKRLDSHII